MNSKTITSAVAVSILAVALMLAALFVARNSTAQTIPPAKSTLSSGVNGRYQIFNGTPELSKNIMLLDTQTGRSWILCSTSDGTDEWCGLDRSDFTASSPKN